MQLESENNNEMIPAIPVGIIFNYFPNLSDVQKKQFEQLWDLYLDWNQKINVISRKDIQNLYLHHVLHSLAIAKWISFKKGSTVYDLGTGGGFPGIPLAIYFPDIQFTLADATGKKIKVVEAVAEGLGLKNVTAIHQRVEEHKFKYDFVVTRAVAEMEILKRWSQKLFKREHLHAIPNGLIALKGGQIKAEIKAMGRGNYTEIVPLTDYFREDFFEEKVLVYLQS